MKLRWKVGGHHDKDFADVGAQPPVFLPVHLLVLWEVYLVWVNDRLAIGFKVLQLGQQSTSSPLWPGPWTAPSSRNTTCSGWMSSCTIFFLTANSLIFSSLARGLIDLLGSWVMRFCSLATILITQGVAPSTLCLSLGWAPPAAMLYMTYSCSNLWTSHSLWHSFQDTGQWWWLHEPSPPSPCLSVSVYFWFYIENDAIGYGLVQYKHGEDDFRKSVSDNIGRDRFSKHPSTNIIVAVCMESDSYLEL